MTVYLDAELPQQRLAHRADSDPRSSFTRAGALNHIADILMTIFYDSRKVRVPRSRQCHCFDSLVHRRNTHLDLPVLPISILDFKRDRRAERQAMAYARAKGHPVLFYFHPPTTAISSLPAF